LPKEGLSLLGFELCRYNDKKKELQQSQLALLRCSSNLTMAVRCSRRHGSAFVIMGLHTPALGCPRRHGLPYRGVRLPLSSWCCFPRRWAARIVVGCPTSVFVPLHRRRVAYLRVGLPTSSWVALPRCSHLFVVVALCGVEPRRSAAHIVVGCLTSVFACLRRRGVACLGVGLPYLGVRLPSSLCGVRPRRSAAVVVRLHTSALGCPAAALASRRRRVVRTWVLGCPTSALALRRRGVSDLDVVVGLAESGGSEALVTAAAKREQQKWATTKVVARFRDVPRIFHFPPTAPPSSAFSFVERDRNGPTSLRRGEGRL